jgi:integrase
VVAYRALEAKIATAALLGLRQGELAGLRWYDI